MMDGLEEEGKDGEREKGQLDLKRCLVFTCFCGNSY